MPEFLAHKYITFSDLSVVETKPIEHDPYIYLFYDLQWIQSLEYSD